MRPGALASATLLGCVALAPAALAQEDVTIVVRGLLPDDPHVTPGATHVIDEATLDRAGSQTGKEALRRIAGLQVVDEDALGLKVNVSVRGFAPRRSSRTLLLEDGAPLQPAPYADPSAHHHPPMERVTAIEAWKGASQIAHGPQSFGGVINFVTADALAAPRASVVVGERGLVGGHARLIATATDDFALGVDVFAKSAAGTRRGHETELGEVVAQARWAIRPESALRFKAAHYKERSAITESGLTHARFDADPFANPFGSDFFELDRTALQIVHEWRPTATILVETQLYGAETYRASYRQTDTSTDAMTANPATGCVGAARTDYDRFAALCGNKMRPRNFLHYGMEVRLGAEHEAFGAPLRTQFGVRLHAEETRRRRYNGLTPDAREASPGSVLRDDNSIDVEALSLFGVTQARFGPLSISPGLRLEQFDVVNVATTANFLPTNRRGAVSSSTLLPGVGVVWALSDGVSLFSGIHRGLAPPRPDRDFDPNAPFNAVKPEMSVTTEVGARGHWAAGSVSATIYDIALEDLIVEGPLVGGRSGSFVNAGEARHQGFEGQADWRFDSGVSLAVAYAHQWTAQFRGDVSESARGVSGNRIPYAPERILDVAIGYERGAWSGELGLNAISSQFADSRNTVAATADGQAGLIPGRTILRAAVTFAPAATPWRVRVTASNLADEVYLATRTDGAFAGARRQVAAELIWRR